MVTHVPEADFGNVWKLNDPTPGEDIMNQIKMAKIAKTFPWGGPITWHQIGPYALLEFYPWEVHGPHVRKGVIGDELSFHGWIDGEDSHESWPTLETGIAGLIGRKYAGANNGGVGYYFCRMVEAPPYDMPTPGES